MLQALHFWNNVFTAPQICYKPYFRNTCIIRFQGRSFYKFFYNWKHFKNNARNSYSYVFNFRYFSLAFDLTNLQLFDLVKMFFRKMLSTFKYTIYSNEKKGLLLFFSLPQKKPCPDFIHMKMYRFGPIHTHVSLKILLGRPMQSVEPPLTSQIDYLHPRCKPRIIL